MLKHLHFVQSLDPLLGSGLGAAALGLHRAMLELGTESSLITTGEGEGHADLEGVVRFRSTGPQKLFYAAGLRQYAREAIESADVVHGHGFYVYPNWAFVSQAIEQGVPLVYHPHGMLEPWALSRSRLRKSLAHLLHESRNQRYAMMWRAITRSEMASISSFGFNAPIIYAPNGVSLSEYDHPVGNFARPLSRDRRHLLFLGRLHPAKGLDLLIPAWATTADAHRDWDLVIAGPSESGYERVVRKAIEKHGVRDSVQLVGAVEGEQKIALMRECSALILPSRSEGSSLVALEAMASRLAVIATRSANVNGLAERGAGIECDSTVTSISGALRRFMSLSQSDLRSQGICGREWVEQEFAWPTIARSILDACEAELR